MLHSHCHWATCPDTVSFPHSHHTLGPHMKMDTDSFVSRTHPAAPSAVLTNPRLHPLPSLPALGPHSREQETAVFSNPFPSLAVGNSHFGFSICFGPKCSTPLGPHLTQPSLHTLHPSAHTAFIHLSPCPRTPCSGARGAPPLRSIVCHLSLLTRPGRTAHSCGLAVKS